MPNIGLQKRRSAFTPGVVLTLGLIVLIIVTVCATLAVGVYPFGPEKVITVKVTRLYVDTLPEGGGSAYMVATDKGVFEVEDSVLLGIFNSDEIYGAMKADETYTIVTKGNRVVNFLMQEYPSIIKVTPRGTNNVCQ